MPARDSYHDVVRSALVKDGWVITDDPYRLTWGIKDLYVDLGAEQLLAAEKQERKIAVEIKSFLGDSEMNDLEKALGQFVLYRALLAEQEPARSLYLAVPGEVVDEFFEGQFGELLRKNDLAHVIGFDPTAEVIVKWIH